MWICKLKWKHDCIIGKRCEKFNVKVIGYPIDFYEEEIKIKGKNVKKYFPSPCAYLRRLPRTKLSSCGNFPILLYPSPLIESFVIIFTLFLFYALKRLAKIIALVFVNVQNFQHFEYCSLRTYSAITFMPNLCENSTMAATNV